MNTVVAWILVAVSTAAPGHLTTPAPIYSVPLTEEGCRTLLKETLDVVEQGNPQAYPPKLKCVKVTIPAPGAAPGTARPTTK